MYNSELPQVSVLSIYRGKLTENRGTPIRVRSLLERMVRDPRLSMTVASWDETLPFSGATHVKLTNKKMDDFRALYSVVRQHHIRVLIGHTMGTWYYSLFLKLFTRIKLVLEMHGFIEVEARFYGSIGLLRYWIEHVVYSWFYRLCDLIITCNPTAAEILSRYNRNIEIVLGGVDTKLFNPDVQPDPRVQNDSGTVLLGYAGNARKWQGVEFLRSAFKKMHQENPEFRLAILSSESRGDLGGEGIQVLPGVPHENVPAFLAACDVLVIPRLDDTVSRISFPSKLSEYMAMGKPVVASATSDAHRVIRDGVDGFVFPPGDTKAFIDTLQRLQDPRLRREIGEQARHSAESFSWERQSDTMVRSVLKLIP